MEITLVADPPPSTAVCQAGNTSFAFLTMNSFNHESLSHEAKVKKKIYMITPVYQLLLVGEL